MISVTHSMWFGRELFHRPQAPQCRHQQRPEISVPMPLSAVITAHLWCRSPSQVWLLVEGSSPRGNDLYFDMYFTLFQFQINKNAANLFWTITAKRTGNSALIQFENIFIVNPRGLRLPRAFRRPVLRFCSGIHDASPSPGDDASPHLAPTPHSGMLARQEPRHWRIGFCRLPNGFYMICKISEKYQ